jgi:ATP-dependent Clp protease ATP-binding subunit ClpA
VSQFVGIFQTFLAGLATPGRPVASLLLLGPTGSGKTRIVEASAEILFGSERSISKVDCAEFQHSHEIAKLIGSPPGYIGHRETKPILSQESLDQYQSEKLRLNLLLLDEIEKASEALWQLLLGILDRGVVTLGDNSKVDLSHTVVFMTSNLGAGEMTRLVTGGIGFAPVSPTAGNEQNLAQKMFRVAVDAARRRFSPEFMNRIDKVIVFRSLTREQLRQVLEIELQDMDRRISASQGGKKFIVDCTPEAKEFLLREGTDPRYGARPLKRAIERHLVSPLSSLISTGQIEPGDSIAVTLLPDGSDLTFSKETPETQPGSSSEQD